MQTKQTDTEINQANLNNHTVYVINEAKNTIEKANKNNICRLRANNQVLHAKIQNKDLVDLVIISVKPAGMNGRNWEIGNYYDKIEIQIFDILAQDDVPERKLATDNLRRIKHYEVSEGNLGMDLRNICKVISQSKVCTDINWDTLKIN